MERILRSGVCPDCGQGPMQREEGHFLCACGKRCVPGVGVVGTSEDAVMLASHGFTFSRDIQRDNYYVGPFNRLVWLYSDGTWWGEPSPTDGVTLEDYLKEVSQTA